MLSLPIPEIIVVLDFIISMRAACFFFSLPMYNFYNPNKMSCTSISIHTRRDVWFVFRSLCPFLLDKYFDHWDSRYFYCHFTESMIFNGPILNIFMLKMCVISSHSNKTKSICWTSCCFFVIQKRRKKHQVFNLVKWLKNFALKSHECDYGHGEHILRCTKWIYWLCDGMQV